MLQHPLFAPPPPLQASFKHFISPPMAYSSLIAIQIGRKFEGVGGWSLLIIFDKFIQTDVSLWGTVFFVWRGKSWTCAFLGTKRFEDGSSVKGRGLRGMLQYLVFSFFFSASFAGVFFFLYGSFRSIIVAFYTCESSSIFSNCSLWQFPSCVCHVITFPAGLKFRIHFLVALLVLYVGTYSGYYYVVLWDPYFLLPPPHQSPSRTYDIMMMYFFLSCRFWLVYTNWNYWNSAVANLRLYVGVKI